ncbi:MAG: hypothetical protein LBQ43_04115 [Holosporales bacterium]|nr:hypothetical protein [Holosporales bacterium]
MKGEITFFPVSLFHIVDISIVATKIGKSKGRCIETKMQNTGIYSYLILLLFRALYGNILFSSFLATSLLSDKTREFDSVCSVYWDFTIHGEYRE